VGRSVLSNVVATQAEMHNKWGGVVPEHAARSHVESIYPVVREAIDRAGRKPEAVAITNRPGLVGSLSVGVSAAKALALAWKVPLIGIHHLEGHLLSVFAESCSPDPPQLPMLSLIVSGGHTELIHVRELGQYEIIAETLDDAAGEALDKGARLLGLGYPGGRSLQMLAESGRPTYPLPRGAARDEAAFSFSGLKTAMLRLVEKEGESLLRADAAASLQQAVVDSLAAKSLAAWDRLDAKSFGLAGGVAANIPLRTRLAQEFGKRRVPFFVPPFELCTDNAGMIGLAASFRLARGECNDWSLEALPQSPLPGG
jgi:N6-L-threonylcarbamoyladenine synthase